MHFENAVKFNRSVFFKDITLFKAKVNKGNHFKLFICL